ncbi:endonuclease III [Candidatus Woesearchaeota archaeon ex4484_78]|nr:MAG: endonuclease III [Candidatus Woesearchaeota archaeon ex4484_78]
MEDKLLQVFNILLDSYGPQGWWPIKGKYSKDNFSRKLERDEVFEICVGAILTQNTAWKNVERALNNLYPLSPEKIKKLTLEELGNAVQPAGYFNQKAIYLKIFADYFLELKNAPSRDELLSVKGIGNETADSILLYAFRRPEFVVDAYTKRLFARLGLIENLSYLETKRFFESNLKHDASLFQEFHALIVEHAKRHCRSKPLCDGCCLRNICKRKIS